MKVSIVTITYNHSKYISQAIESFLMQNTNFEFEVIIADDASTDNNQEIIREYQKKYPKIIKPILREENIGMNYNFVDAVNQCKGKYIALCEGDDYWTDPLKLQKQVDFLEANEDYGLVYSDIDVIDSEGRIIDDSVFYTKISSRFCSGNIFEELIVGNFVPTPSVCIRKVVLDDFFNRFKGEKYTIDYRLWLHASTLGKVKYLSENMCIYRDHNQGLSKVDGYFDRMMPLIRQSAMIYYYKNKKNKVSNHKLLGKAMFSVLYSRNLKLNEKAPIIKLLIIKPIMLFSIVYYIYRKLTVK